jgi:hypothetical protein
MAFFQILVRQSQRKEIPQMREMFLDYRFLFAREPLAFFGIR